MAGLMGCRRETATRRPAPVQAGGGSPRDGLTGMSTRGSVARQIADGR